MSYASERMIEIHNSQMDSDEEYAENYRHEMEAAADAQLYFEQQLDDEIFIDWFPDRLIDYKGQSFELKEKVNEFGAKSTDDDLPF